MKLVNETSHVYRMLRAEFPESEIFYEYYYSGDYYNTAYTEYFDQNEKSIKIVNHGYYG